MFQEGEIMNGSLTEEASADGEQAQGESRDHDVTSRSSGLRGRCSVSGRRC